MGKIENDKYYTPPELAKNLIELTYNTIGYEWDRIIEPSAGTGSFLQFLPKSTLAYDIEPMASNIIQADYRMVQLPYMEKSLVIGNPPFGGANRLSRQFVLTSLKHSPYIAFIQPISQLDNNYNMSNTELILSKDLGKVEFSSRKLHVCFNIYHYKLNGHKKNYNIPGIKIEVINRARPNSKILQEKWDYRISAWGSIKLLNDNEVFTKEIGIKAETKEMKYWLDTVIQFDYSTLVANKNVAMPDLPKWQVEKYLYEKYRKFLDKTEIL